jgi:hypothetical protein
MLAPRRTLLHLRETPLVDDHRAWFGRKVLDVRGHALGRVRDILIEHRSLEESAREDPTGRSWGVRAVYAVVVSRRGLLRRRSLLLPVAQMRDCGPDLRCAEDALAVQALLGS